MSDLALDDNSSMTSMDINSSVTTMDVDPETRAVQLKTTVDDLINRCKKLYDEVETYVAAVDANQKLAKIQNPVGE